MIINFPHQQTAHCENGTAMNLLKNKGLTLSEPMIFGIGSGLFFFYLPLLKINNAPAISYRPMPGTIFNKVAKRLNIKIKRKKFSNPKKAQEALDKNLKKNIPTGLQVGVYHLPYFPEEYRFHFNAHNLVVYGKENETYLISDPVMNHPTTLTEEELNLVRYAQGALAPKGHLYFPYQIPENINLKKAIKIAISDTCNQMLAPVPIIGVKAIKRLAQHIALWPEKKGTKITNYYLAQIIRMQEEIGTGGGGFRFIYAAFLQECASVFSKSEFLNFSKEMTQIGDLWRDFALEISRVYKNRNNKENIYQDISKKLLEISELEKVFFKKLKKFIKNC